MIAETPTDQNKNCLECGQPLGAGREDRKYCNDICRTAYNNRRRKEPLVPIIPDYGDRIEASTNAAIEKVCRILERNRIILVNMTNLYESVCSLNDFYGFGVNLKYFSSEYKDDNGEVYRMCFDYGYRISGAKVYLIYNGGEIHFN